MKLEVGMYVRTKNDKAVGNGIIGKIKYINEREFKGKLRKYYSVWTNNEDWFEILENNVAYERIKASHNIIDLIEVGDFIDGKQVVNAIHCKDGFNRIELFGGKAIMNKTPINSIVTKEQFESMKYSLEG